MNTLRKLCFIVLIFSTVKCTSKPDDIALCPCLETITSVTNEVIAVHDNKYKRDSVKKVVQINEGVTVCFNLLQQLHLNWEKEGYDSEQINTLYQDTVYSCSNGQDYFDSQVELRNLEREVSNE